MANPLAVHGGAPTITTPRPHFTWGNPTNSQILALKEYINRTGAMSIYGDTGIYRALEQSIEELFQVPYCILTNTGTSSLNSAYVGLGLQPGDEVLVPTYTFLATVTPLLRIGAVPVFVDADPDTGNIDPLDLAGKVNPKTRAAAITHMWGVPCDMERIVDICKLHRLLLIEDCSHAHLTRYKGQLCGTFGDVACFSIGAKKTWTSGEGGFLITSQAEIFMRASLLGHFEVRAKEATQRIRSDGHTALADMYAPLTSGYGENYRMHPFSAVMAKAFLESDLAEIIQRRAESLRYFSALLSEIPGIEPPVVDEDYYTGAMYGFKAKLIPGEVGYEGPIEGLVAAIKAENVEIKLPDSAPLNMNPLFVSVDNKYSSPGKQPARVEGTFDGAARYLDGRVSLPTFSGGLANDRTIIEQYADAIEKVLAQARSLDWQQGHLL